MINKPLLQRLAKLRQYKNGNISEFLQTEFRQNMLAIESAIRALSTDAFYVRTQIEAFNTAQNAVDEIVFSNSSLRSDVNGCIDASAYVCKSSGWYLVKFNIPNVLCPAGNNIFVSYIINDQTVQNASVLNNTTGVNLTLPFTLQFYLELNTDDVLRFAANNSGGSATASTSDVGVLEIQQITGAQ